MSLDRTQFLGLPTVSGKPTDLYLLYTLVTKYGGFHKVCTFLSDSSCLLPVSSLIIFYNDSLLYVSILRTKTDEYREKACFIFCVIFSNLDDLYAQNLHGGQIDCEITCLLQLNSVILTYLMN